MKRPPEKMIYAAWDRIDASVARVAKTLPADVLAFFAERADYSTGFRDIMQAELDLRKHDTDPTTSR